MTRQDNAYYSKLYRLWSVAAFGAGSKLLGAVMSELPDAEQLYMSLRDGQGPAAAVKAAADTSLETAEKILDICDKKHISVVSSDEDNYPQQLKRLFLPPPVLFYKGTLEAINDVPAIAVVGTRKPSEYSRKVASAIVSTLSQQGFSIVSGMAEGIDICAHLSAVRSGSLTYAVMGCGVDVNYPAANDKYRQHIYENGAVISEYLPGTRPIPRNFPVRNRIIAGLSIGLAVIEAGERSGSLNSAGHAAEQGIPVFAVPPNDLFDSRYKGNADIIRKGAIPLMGARDIYSEYITNPAHTIIRNEAMDAVIDRLRTVFEQWENGSYENKYAVSEGKGSHKASSSETAVKENQEFVFESAPAKENIPAYTGENETEQAIIRALTANPSGMRADALAEEYSADIGDVLIALTDMEIAGAVTSQNGNYILYR